MQLDGLPEILLSTRIIQTVTASYWSIVKKETFSEANFCSANLTQRNLTQFALRLFQENVEGWSYILTVHAL